MKKVLEMNLEELEARKAEIRSLNIDEMNEEDVKATTEEIDAIEARLKELKKVAEDKRDLRAKIARGAEGKVIEGEKDNMPEVITRNSVEYQRAFINAIKTGKWDECRALLSENATNGTIAVPEVLENEIRNAWEEHKLLSICDNTSIKGNDKVSFEYAASNATTHTEGGSSISEGSISIGMVEIKPEMLMKYVTCSVEAIENTTIDTLASIYKSLANKLADLAEAKVVGYIDAAPNDASTASACQVMAATVATLDEATVADALSYLSGQAKNVHLLMNRRTKAAFVGIAKKAKYAVDVFDGLADRIIFTDALPAFQGITAAGEGETPTTYFMAGDFGYGFRVNRPNGDEMKIVLDEVTLADKAADKVIGRQNVGFGVIAPKAFVKLNK